MYLKKIQSKKVLAVPQNHHEACCIGDSLRTQMQGPWRCGVQIWAVDHARARAYSREKPLGLTVHPHVIDKVIICVSMRATVSFYRAVLWVRPLEAAGAACLLYTACINKPVYRQHFTHLFTVLSHLFLLACLILFLLTLYLWKNFFLFFFLSWSCHSSATGAVKRNPQLCDLRTSRLEARQTNWRRHSRLCFCCCGIW